MPHYSQYLNCFRCNTLRRQSGEPRPSLKPCPTRSGSGPHPHGGANNKPRPGCWSVLKLLHLTLCSNISISDDDTLKRQQVGPGTCTPWRCGTPSPSSPRTWPCTEYKKRNCDVSDIMHCLVCSRQDKNVNCLPFQKHKEITEPLVAHTPVAAPGDPPHPDRVSREDKEVDLEHRGVHGDRHSQQGHPQAEPLDLAALSQV